MNKTPSKMQIEMLRECYPKGMRVQLDRMYDDPYPIPPGTKGTVEGIDDYGHLMMKWDNGRTLSLVWDKDSFHKIGMENVPAAERYPHLVGYAIDGNKRLRSIEAVAEFICTHGQYGDVQIKNDDGFELISANGVMIDRLGEPYNKSVGDWISNVDYVTDNLEVSITFNDNQANEIKFLKKSK